MSATNTRYKQYCQQCVDYAHKQVTGSWPSGAAYARWANWGCTCPRPWRLTRRGRSLRDASILIIGMTAFLIAMGYVGYIEGL